jgi:quercetin dioxygenase-like cupin family protein
MTSKPIQSRSGRYRPTIPNGASRSRDPIPTKARPHPGSSETPTRSCSLATIQVGRYCLIDMHIPLGGGRPPHRHDFEESFTLLKGEIEATFRGEKSLVRAGETINIPANAPHSFTNASKQTVRLLCLCVPAGQEEFFAQVGAPVATRTSTPPS